MTTPRAAPRPHSGARGRASHRPKALALLALVVCGSFLLVWRSWWTPGAAPSGFATSLSGHSYHPKLCGSTSDSSSTNSSSNTPAGGCGELHDPLLAGEVVRLPRDLKPLSDDPQVAALHQLLQAAAQQQWPLPLARRVTLLLLQNAVPAVGSSSSGTKGAADSSNTQPGSGPTPQLSLSAAESGHAAGWRFVTEALAVLKQRGGSHLVPCSFDPSLPTDFHTRFLFTAAWPATGSSSTGSAAPHANSVLQLLNAVALLPPGYAFISLHVPAGAAADSLAWLDLLQLLAAPLGVPVRLVQGQAPAAGTAADAASAAALPAMPRQGDQLAPPGSPTAGQALNAALGGFFPAEGASAGEAAASAAAASGQLGSDPDPSSSTSTSRGSVRHGSCPPGAPAPGCYAPEFVVLLEPQLFFCAGDVLRLMEYPEDLACGLQLDEHAPTQLRHRRTAHRRRLLAKPRSHGHHAKHTHHTHHKHSHSHSHHHSQHHAHHDTPAAALHRRLLQQQAGQAAAPAAASGGVVVDGPMASAVTAAGLAVLKPEVPPEFEMHSLRAAYDAAREINGDMLSALVPYFAHPASQAVVQAGLPVPMYCCWGGLAKLSAGPLAAGLRFRGGEEGECRPPDHMSLMCDDLWRTGHNRIILDPGVRTSSQLRAKSLFEHPRFPFFYYTNNWETTAWFDIHPLLPLQYWNKTAAGAPTTSSRASNSSSNAAAAAADSDTDAGLDPGAAAAGASAASAALWVPGDWEPGRQRMCCEGQQWSGAARPNHPTDCRRVDVLTGKNHTAAFLQRCAAGLHHRQGSGLGPECG